MFVCKYVKNGKTAPNLEAEKIGKYIVQYGELTI